MELITGITLAVALLFFFSFSLVMLRHTARFRYLSSRTVYLSLGYVSLATLIILLAFITYLIILFN